VSSDVLCTRGRAALATTVGDRVVLYHRESRTSVVLNPTARWIWQELSAPRTIGELAKALQGRFPSVSSDDARRDVDAFVADLAKHDLVTLGAA
jgi:hypothetical protein